MEYIGNEYLYVWTCLCICMDFYLRVRVAFVCVCVCVCTKPVFREHVYHTYPGSGVIFSSGLFLQGSLYKYSLTCWTAISSFIIQRHHPSSGGLNSVHRGAMVCWVWNYLTTFLQRALKTDFMPLCLLMC